MKKTPLYFTSIKIKIRTLIAIIYNGSSEFFSNIAGSILMIILNTILLRISGSMAVAAFSVVMYIDSIVISIMYGITDSMQPPISYCYGARLRKRMYAMEKRALAAGAVISAVTFICMRCFGDTITSLFIKGSNPELMNLSLQAIELFSLTYIAMWIPFILSAFFTAVNKPGLSLGISMCRSLLFPLAAVPLLVHFLGVDGVWLTASVSSTLSAIVSVFFLVKFVRKERTSNPEKGE